MKNLGQMMQKAQEVQQHLADMQAMLAGVEIAGQSGGGMVQVTLTGRFEAKKVKLDPKAMDPTDLSMIEDLIVAAFNDARAKAEAHVQEETQKIMGGMGLPAGIKLPF